MRINPLIPRLVGGALLAALLVCLRADATQTPTDAIDLVRSTYKGDRQAFLAAALQLNETESAAFWPLYRSYRADIDQIGDSLVKLVLEYADVYPNVPEKRAQAMLKQYTALEQKLANKRAWYFKRAGRVLPAVKALRWAQLENRMDLVLRLQLAGTIPLVPTGQGKPSTTP
jgi:hypothetical protein